MGILTALKYWTQIASFVAGAALVGSVWAFIERGEIIDALTASNKSKTAVITVVQKKATKEKEITDDREKRIERLEQVVKDHNAPMSPAVRAAIDSLPD